MYKKLILPFATAALLSSSSMAQDNGGNFLSNLFGGMNTDSLVQKTSGILGGLFSNNKEDVKNSEEQIGQVLNQANLNSNTRNQLNQILSGSQNYDLEIMLDAANKLRNQSADLVNVVSQSLGMDPNDLVSMAANMSGMNPDAVLSGLGADSSFKQQKPPKRGTSAIKKPKIYKKETIVEKLKQEEFVNKFPTVDYLRLQGQSTLEGINYFKLGAATPDSSLDSAVTDTSKKEVKVEKTPIDSSFVLLDGDTVKAYVENLKPARKKIFGTLLKKMTGSDDLSSLPKVIPIDVELTESEVKKMDNRLVSSLWEKYKPTMYELAAKTPDLKMGTGASSSYDTPKQITFDGYGSKEPCLSNNGIYVAYRSNRNNKPVIVQSLLSFTPATDLNESDESLDFGDVDDSDTTTEVKSNKIITTKSDNGFMRSFEGKIVRDLDFEGNSRILYSFHDGTSRKIMNVDFSKLGSVKKEVISSNVKNLNDPTYLNEGTIFVKGDNLYLAGDSLETIVSGIKTRSPVVNDENLYFISNFEGGENVYLLNEDESITNLTNDNLDIVNFDVSSRYVVVQSINDDMKTSKTQVIDTKTNEKIYLPHDNISSFDLSDDGVMVYTTGTLENSQVNVLKLDTKDNLIVGEGYYPCISGDGSKIAYLNDIGGIDQVFAYDIPKDISKLPKTTPDFLYSQNGSNDVEEEEIKKPRRKFRPFKNISINIDIRR